MKHSIRAVTLGDAAYQAEVSRLQVSLANGAQVGGDPLLRATPDAPREPSEVEMLLEGLREVEMESE